MINLTKGECVSLDKGLKLVRVQLGWSPCPEPGEDFDLDASAFLLDESGKVRTDADFIFYHQLKSQCLSVVHSGDELVGGGETINVDLSRVPADVARIVFTVSIYDSIKRRQNFGRVEDAYICLVDADTNTEQFRFDLTEDASTNDAIVFGELYCHNGAWQFRALAQGFAGGLGALARSFGVNVK